MVVASPAGVGQNRPCAACLIGTARKRNSGTEMKKLADVLALLTFLIGVGFFLYGQSTYTSLKAELDQDEAECRQLPEMGIEKFNCAMGTINSSGRVHDAEEMRNFGFAFAIGGPVAIWLFVLLWRVASPKVQKGAMQGAKVGRIAVDELSKRSARATKDVVGAVAQISDSAQGRTRECPFCAEMIKPQAKVCRHCGNDVA